MKDSAESPTLEPAEPTPLGLDISGAALGRVGGWFSGPQRAAVTADTPKYYEPGDHGHHREDRSS